MRLLYSLFLVFLSIALSSQSEAWEATGEKLELWATYYYVPHMSHAEDGIPLLDKDGNELGFKLDSCDWCDAAVEGTVFIKKDKKTYVLNYATRSDELLFDCRKCAKYKNYKGYMNTGKVLWSFSSGFGRGVKNYYLVPFKTIAVDNSAIPYGSVLYIPDAKGVQYANTHGDVIIHDGYFFAGDTGSEIKGNHIDVFIGDATDNPFSFIKENSTKTFSAYLVKDQKTISKLEKAHR